MLYNYAPFAYPSEKVNPPETKNTMARCSRFRRRRQRPVPLSSTTATATFLSPGSSYSAKRLVTFRFFVGPVRLSFESNALKDAGQQLVRCGFESSKGYQDAFCSDSFDKRHFGPCTTNLENIGVFAVRSVAQPGSALDWGSRGRRFESGHSDQIPRQSPSKPKRLAAPRHGVVFYLWKRLLNHVARTLRVRGLFLVGASQATPLHQAGQRRWRIAATWRTETKSTRRRGILG
jgi:hypothetical protein